MEGYICFEVKSILMKFKIVQLIFLIVAGLIIGWREWSKKEITTLREDALFNSEQFQEVGSTSEASIVFIIFLLGVFVAFMMSNLRITPIKLSSPNSV